MPQDPDDVERRVVPVRPASSVSARISDGDGRFVAGAMLSGRYRIVSLLGRGGMGEVFKAEDLKLNQTVALKFLPEAIALDGGALARFHNEVRIARQVAHPNVCRVYDIGEVDGRHFLSMEFIDGEDLSSLLRRIGRLPGDKAVELARQMCEGLAAAHEAGVLHRDLKPANVMIDGRGKARITDFGLAVVSEELRGDDVIAGTPAYMAPEQLTGKEATQRSDIYSLGLVLYELFTGKRVYETQSIHELIELHDKSAPATPSSYVKDIDPLAERVILRCLEKDPKARPTSAVQVALALPGGDPLQAALAMGETPSPEMVAASGDKTGLRPRLAVACLVAIIGLLAVFAWMNGKVALFASAPLENSAEALARRGRDLATQLGYVERPAHTDYGFTRNVDFLSYAGAGGTSGDRSLLSKERLATGRPPAYEFWYRESPVFLLGSKVGGPVVTGRVFLSDPPNDVSGMVGIRLDSLGRLRYFTAAPPQLEQASERASPAKPFDRIGLFSAAGLERSSFIEAASQWIPPSICDERAAWTGTYPDQPEVPIRLEAAAYRGKLVFFQIIEPWTKPERVASIQQGRIPGLVGGILTLTVLAAGFALGWRNYRMDRGDRRGAFKLAVFAAVTFTLNWILSASHAPIVRENDNVLAVIGISSFIALATWSMYMAVEPFIRRRLPETIITWSRLLAGQFRDPLVGRDVLIGILAAVGYRAVNVLVLSWTSTTPTVGIHPDSLLDTRHNLGILTNSFIGGLTGVMVLFEFFLLRLILRKQWLAAALVILISAIGGVSASGEVSVVNVSLWVVAYVGGVVLLLRYGLVAGCVYFFANTVLILYPVTSTFSLWYSSSGMFAIAVTLALAGYTFFTSLGGQKLFDGKLLEE